uniref:ATP-binding protein n=1 Tax=uncultured Sphingomonas sp. TaxID=158754 RepID=UPI0035CB546D
MWGFVSNADSEHLGEQRTFGPFVLAPKERLLTRDGKPVEIGGRAFDLLVTLTEQPGTVFSKRELLKRVWAGVVVEDGSVRFHMAGLRKHLRDGEDGARYIATQIGVGYAFVAPVERTGAEHAWHATSSEPAATISLTTTTNLPLRLAHLIGRDHDLDILTKRVVDESLFSIIGPAGVGKTSLAIEVAHRLSPQFAGHTAFVDFAMLENATVVPSMIAGAMGLSIQSGDPVGVIVGHLREESFLLVLDNCEHVIEAAADVVERIISEAPGARILTTSREPLRVRGEHVHRLDALAYPDATEGLHRTTLLAFPAVQLFCERARAADSALVFDDEALRMIGDLCARLDGIALPIELAAVRVASHGLAATARQIGERFSLAWSGRRTAQPRQQTLQATLDWSYDLLTPIEQIVMERLSIFVGSFSIDAALAIAATDDCDADAVALAVDELVSKSLIAATRTGNAGTYRLLEMTRAYAREKLNARGRTCFLLTASRHANFFVTELEAAAADDGDGLEDVRALRPQLGNIRSALDWCFGTEGDVDTGVRLAAASLPVFMGLTHLLECRSWSARALGALDDAQLGTVTELELQGALGLSLMFTRGNSTAAGNALTRALAVADALADYRAQIRMFGLLHIFHERIGEYQTALAYAERAVSVAESMADPEAMGIAYSLSGISRHLAGDQARARHDLDLALASSPPSHRARTSYFGFDHRNRAGIALARTLWLLGQSERAGVVARATVAEAARLDHPVTHCIAMIWSFAVYLWIGDLETAEQTLETFAQCAAANALGPYIAATGGLRGELAIQRGAGDTALEAVEESLSRLRAARYELLTTPFSIALANGLINAKRPTEAVEVIDATLSRCERIGELFATPELLRLKAAVIARRQNGADEATALLQVAAALAVQQGSVAWTNAIAVQLVQLAGA